MLTIKLRRLRAISGFRWAGISAQLKASRKKDLALVVTDQSALAAGAFTPHLLPGAPIVVGREHIQDGTLQGIVVNSGNANVFNGKAGIRDAKEMCRVTASALGLASPSAILPASTGIIGQPLPIEKICKNIPRLTRALGTRTEHILDFADAILTTDVTAKLASVEITFPQDLTKTKKPQKVNILAIAKGAGMIEPNMATMLCYLFSDAVATPTVHKKALHGALETTLNALSVDSDMSTSDMTVSLLSQASGITVPEAVLQEGFRVALEVIAKKILTDGEGATRTLRFSIAGAPSLSLAESMARSLAGSILVKTALYGKDPNWGRILMAIGKIGKIGKTGGNTVKNELKKLSKPLEETLELRFYAAPPELLTTTTTRIKTSRPNGRTKSPAAIVIRSGKALTRSENAQLKKWFTQKTIYLVIDLHAGTYHKTFAMTDLSESYLRFNSAYHT